MIYGDNFLEAIRNGIEIRQCDNFKIEKCYNFMPIRIFVVRYVVPTIVFSKILAPKEYHNILNEIENPASVDSFIKVQSIDVESETVALHECYLDSGKTDYAGCERKVSPLHFFWMIFLILNTFYRPCKDSKLAMKRQYESWFQFFKKTLRQMRSISKMS